MTYLKPLTIGNLTLAHNILFGPMAGISDLPYRLLCHEAGAALTCTELISAKAITYKNKNTKALLELHPAEHPVAVQLFGHEAEVMAKAVRMLSVSPDILDLNAGCPVPKVVGNGEGSALMKQPRLIEALGGNKMSAFGLCHLGDYEATLFSPWSHNRMYGEDFVKGKKFEKLAEGVMTSKALPNFMGCAFVNSATFAPVMNAWSGLCVIISTP